MYPPRGLLYLCLDWLLEQVLLHGDKLENEATSILMLKIIIIIRVN